MPVGRRAVCAAAVTVAVSIWATPANAADETADPAADQAMVIAVVVPAHGTELPGDPGTTVPPTGTSPTATALATTGSDIGLLLPWGLAATAAAGTGAAMVVAGARRARSHG